MNMKYFRRLLQVIAVCLLASPRFPSIATGQSVYEDFTFVSLAGPGTAGPNWFDGQGSAARFNAPLGVAHENNGNTFIADSQNHTVRKITADGLVTTLAGFAGFSGYADGVGAEARFNSPFGIALDGAGNVYVAD